MVEGMGKLKGNIVFLIDILHGWGLFEFKSGFPWKSTQGRHKFKIWFRSFLARR